MKKLLGLALGGMLLSSTAMAADMSAPAPYDWTGYYIGGQAPIAFVHFNEVTPFNLESATNIGGGLDAQALWQSDSLVFGLAADANFLTGDSVAPCIVGAGLTCKVGSNWNASVRGKLGFAADRVLFYGTAGWGWADTHVNITDALGNVQSDSHVLNGWVAGGGVAFAINDQWSADVEYLHYDLGSANVTQFVAFGTGNTKPTMDTLSFGLNYKF